MTHPSIGCGFLADGDNCNRQAESVRIMPAGTDWIRVEVCQLHARHLDTLEWARRQRSHISEQQTP